MNKLNLAINIISLLCLVNAEDARIFPQTLSFGMGSSAYQIEGAWNEDGKSENIWDRWIHSDPSHIKNNDTADVAAGSYNSILNDVFYVALSGVQHYRLSIPWTRILPTGFSDNINTKAVTHYQNMLQNLRSFNVTPIVTLYYHDLPQSLQDIGGWTNPAMVKYFADYSRVCFQYFPNVYYWITFNDPRATCRRGYGEGTFAPGINSDGIGEYLCAYTVLKAHAAAYHVYKEEFKVLNGKISMAIDMQWSEPASTNDTSAVERRNAFEFGLYANPIYKGNWPQEVIDRIDYRSEKENFTKSRLPKFTDEEIDYINGTSDFMAVNLFYTNVVEDTKEAKFGDPSYAKDMKVKVSLNSNWSLAVNGQPIVPWSARKTLTWLSSSFNNPDIFITGNGIPDENPSYDDTRVSYFRDYLNAILDAIINDGVKVIGYTAYSLFDSFEWTDGYSYKFGFYYDYQLAPVKVNKHSLNFYKQVIKTFTIPAENITTSTTNPPTTPDSAPNIVLYPALVLATLFLFKLL
uniref:Myrosinase 1 n=1 Tax=Anoplophora glabripennis TaxID=217634 RepID=V5GJ69_ANOGL